MMAGLTTSELGERLAYEAVTDARWRRHLKVLRDRLRDEQERVAGRLLQLGFEIFAEPKMGLFLWARHPACPDASELSALAAQNDILLGPGHLFSTSHDVSGWIRFNVSYCDDERIFDFLQRQLCK
jgi:DNA-binding transcriptional MocR family regulator